MKTLIAIAMLLLICTGCESQAVPAQPGHARLVAIRDFKYSECDADILINDGEWETRIGSLPVTIKIYEDFTTAARIKLSIPDRDELLAKLQAAESKLAVFPHRPKRQKGGYRKIEPQPTNMQCFNFHEDPLSGCWVRVSDRLTDSGRKYGPSGEDGIIKITEKLNHDSWLTVEWHPPAGETGINSGTAQFKDWEQPLSFYFDTREVDERLRDRGMPRR